MPRGRKTLQLSHGTGLLCFRISRKSFWENVSAGLDMRRDSWCSGGARLGCNQKMYQRPPNCLRKSEMHAV